MRLLVVCLLNFLCLNLISMCFFCEAKLFFLNLQFLCDPVSQKLPFTIHRAFLGQGGTTAQWPDVSRLVECVIILLVERQPAGLRQSGGGWIDRWGRVMRGYARIRRLVILSKRVATKADLARPNTHEPEALRQP